VIIFGDPSTAMHPTAAARRSNRNTSAYWPGRESQKVPRGRRGATAEQGHVGGGTPLIKEMWQVVEHELIELGFDEITVTRGRGAFTCRMAERPSEKATTNQS
jgi:hypothetical protein